MRYGRKILSVAVIAALLALTPGLGCYEALAVVIRSQTGAVAARVAVPGQVGGLTSLPTVSSQLKLFPLSLAAPLEAIQQVPTVPAQIPPLSAVATVWQAPAAVAPITTQEVLQAGVEKLSHAPAGSETKTVLDEVYTGAQKSVDPAGAVVVLELSGSAVLTPALAAVTPSSQKSVSELQAVANDCGRPFDERVAAVSAIAAKADGEVKAGLKSIGRANPDGSATDYEVKRKALQALAGLGEVVSLPPVSRAHADEILRSLSLDKPQAAIFDYDGTLEANQVPASAETAEALKASADAGVETMILTARSDRVADHMGSSILESLSTLTPEQKRGLVVGSNRGSRLLIFDDKGDARLIDASPVWTAQEREAINVLAAEVKARYGEVAFQGQTGQMTDYGYSLYLPVGARSADVDAAAQLMREGLARRGMPVKVEGRTAANPRNPSYLVVSKFDKSHGVELLRKNRDLYPRIRDVLQKLPVKLQGLGIKLVGLLPRSTVPQSRTLVVGDHLFGMRTEDLDMHTAAPHGLALAVGGEGDPRPERVFVWPTRGHAATQEILGALGRKDADGVDQRSLFGIFTSRTASIAAFFLTSTAYAFIAIPAVGLAAYGALMALGPLAAIALGPLNGLLAQKLSARNAMALNTVLNVVMLLTLPIMSALGIVNFWTLLVASIGNGWVLSSVMTTDGIYVKRFSGKYLGTVNALTMIDYLSVQSLLGLILRAGRLLPTAIVDRPKLGFNPPMGVWLKGELKPLVDERLTPGRMARAGLEWAPIARLLAEHQGGRRDHALKIWALLTLDAWREGTNA